jgi:hypothetical protein
LFFFITEETSLMRSGIQASGTTGSTSPIFSTVSRSKRLPVDASSSELEMLRAVKYFNEERIVDSTKIYHQHSLGYMDVIPKHLNDSRNERLSSEPALYTRTNNVLPSMESAQHNNMNKMKEWQHRTKLNDQAFGIVIFPICIFCLIVSVLRAREECTGRNHRSDSPPSQRLRFMRPRDDARWSAHAIINQERFTSVLNMLDLINQDRLERGEPTVSLNSYLAFQQVLNDRSIWNGLAERLQQEGGRSGRNSDTSFTSANGISQQQLEHISPQWKSTTEDVLNKECSICLTAYEFNDILRTLPCSHIFHKDCLDRWMRQSSYCPMCKRCLA